MFRESASFDVEELSEIRTFLIATGPAFVCIVEKRNTRVMTAGIYKEIRRIFQKNKLTWILLTVFVLVWVEGLPAASIIAVQHGFQSIFLSEFLIICDFFAKNQCSGQNICYKIVPSETVHSAGAHIGIGIA